MGLFSNNIVISFGLIFILIISGYSIGTFFGIKIEYYLPFLLWLLALCVFNMFLNQQHVNIYLEKPKIV